MAILTYPLFGISWIQYSGAKQVIAFIPVKFFIILAESKGSSFSKKSDNVLANSQYSCYNA